MYNQPIHISVKTLWRVVCQIEPTKSFITFESQQAYKQASGLSLKSFRDYVHWLEEPFSQEK